jgi:hypothetical protein
MKHKGNTLFITNQQIYFFLFLPDNIPPGPLLVDPLNKKGGQKTSLVFQLQTLQTLI